MRLARPVKWTADRSEAFLSDHQARELVTRAELALDKTGKILALRLDHLYSVGAYTTAFGVLSNGIRIVTGSYDIPNACVTAKAVLTNTLPTTYYRGAGRPEAMFNLERIIQHAATTLEMDPLEIRRNNLIPNTAFPYTSPAGVVYDCGEFAQGMDMAVDLSDWDGFAARKKKSEPAGMLRGIGICNYIEIPAGQIVERTQVTVGGDGHVDIVIGTGPSGRGHETVFAQVISEYLGVPFDGISVRIGDTAFVLDGGGTQSNRSMRLGGTVLVHASETIIEKGKRIAAELMEAAEADIDFSDGVFAISGTDRSMGIFEIAAAAEKGDGLPEELPEEFPDELRGPLAADREINNRYQAFPNGRAVAEVEIDPDTGHVTLARYAAVDDVGRIVNPMIVHGQVHGGAAQGIGQALLEDIVYDADSGQMLTGTFMDYCLPRADDLPSFELGELEVPAPSNPLGVKGGGEGGTTPSFAAVINAVVDALKPFGVDHIPMPATPERVWRAIHGV